MKYEITLTPRAFQYLVSSKLTYKTPELLFQLQMMYSSTLVVTQNLLEIYIGLAANDDAILLGLDINSQDQYRILPEEDNDGKDPYLETFNAARSSLDGIVVGYDESDISLIGNDGNFRLASLCELESLNVVPSFYVLAKIGTKQIAKTILFHARHYRMPLGEIKRMRESVRNDIFDLLIRTSQSHIYVTSQYALQGGNVNRFAKPLAQLLVELKIPRKIYIIGTTEKKHLPSLKRLIDDYPDIIRLYNVDDRLWNEVHDRKIYSGDMNITLTNEPCHLTSQHVRLEIEFSHTSSQELETLRWLLTEAWEVAPRLNNRGMLVDCGNINKKCMSS